MGVTHLYQGATPMATPRKKRVDTPSSPELSTEGVHQVYGEMLITMISDLQELVLWWQERKATLHQASDASRETTRTTFHVEQRWIDAIRRQSDLDGLSITQVVNAIFQHHFSRK
jgi:hypothetical protein